MSISSVSGSSPLLELWAAQQAAQQNATQATNGDRQTATSIQTSTANSTSTAAAGSTATDTPSLSSDL